MSSVSQKPVSKIFFQDQMINLKNVESIHFHEHVKLEIKKDHWSTLSKKDKLGLFAGVKGMKSFSLDGPYKYRIDEGTPAYDIIYKYLKHHGWNEQFKRDCYRGGSYVGTYYCSSVLINNSV